VPFGGGTPFDLVAVRPGAGELIRIQVKSGRIRKGAVTFNTTSTDHGNGRQTYIGRADVIAVHLAQTEEIFVLPVEDCPSFMGRLRLTPTRNNQVRRVRFAANHTFAGWVKSLGGSSIRPAA
jgi:hypothetical protein